MIEEKTRTPRNATIHLSVFFMMNSISRLKKKKKKTFSTTCFFNQNLRVNEIKLFSLKSSFV